MRIDPTEIDADLERDIELQWDRSFARSQDSLTKLGDKALADYQAGNTELLDPNDL